MHELQLEFEVLTPLFWGGADQLADLRPPALKGLLRFWYRAIDPCYSMAWESSWMTREARFFGGTAHGAGQSPFLVRIGSSPPSMLKWSELRVGRFNQGQGRERRNGLVYLGFPFQLRRQSERLGRQNERNAIAPGHRFSVRCLLPNNALGEKLRQALVASCWLLGHLGSAGSRARRGFGSLALREWSPSRGEWPELDELSLLSNSAEPESWLIGLQQARQVFAKWFPDNAGSNNERLQHPHLGPSFRTVLQSRSFPRQQWDAALNHMGRLLQDFRLRRQPDYEAIKDHVSRRRPLQTTPSRASFGLPLTFRYASVQGRPVTFVPFDRERRLPLERHGSLLHLRLAAIGDQFYPLFIRLGGDVPGQHPPAVIRGDRSPLRGVQDNAMDRFLDSIETERN
jgi:CRISPR-associated protein Cmr1